MNVTVFFFFPCLEKVTVFRNHTWESSVLFSILTALALVRAEAVYQRRDNPKNSFLHRGRMKKI